MVRFLEGKYWLFIVLTLPLIVTSHGCDNSGLITPPPQSLGANLNSQAAEKSPNFSHNGRYLVFASDRRQQRSIFVYDLQLRRLVPLRGLNQPGIMQYQPDISADGRYIVYVSEHYGKPDIFVYDRQNMRAVAITRNLAGEVRNPTISGNGRFIAFEANRSGQWDLEIYDRGASIDPSLIVPKKEQQSNNN